MTEREKELLGYIGELLSLSRRETRWRGPRETWERIADATREDRRNLHVERLTQRGFTLEGGTWTSADGLITIATKAA